MLEQYWSSLPVGKESAITYEELCEKWQCSNRIVRRILHDLSAMDNGDDYVLIRSSQNKGFYLTNDMNEIEKYRKECMNRAKHTFAPLKKITRIQKDDGQRNLFENPLKSARLSKGLSQKDVCDFLKSKGTVIDTPLLSKYENSICSPTINQTMLLACLYEVDPYELMKE